MCETNTPTPKVCDFLLQTVDNPLQPAELCLTFGVIAGCGTVSNLRFFMNILVILICSEISRSWAWKSAF